jgi:hypothetical protein
MIFMQLEGLLARICDDLQTIMGKIVDIAIQVYGKPYQTLAALKTLMLHSGEHIDKIYFILEKKQPYNSDFDFVLKQFSNIIHFIPKRFLFITPSDRQRYGDEDYRHSLRYQYAWEKTDKEYLFITHNDTVYHGDIVGEMLKIMHNDKYAGTGLIGQCWNCPAFFANECNGDKYSEYNPSYEEVMRLIRQIYPKRGKQFISSIDIKCPMPLPECRLNEFACLINLKKIKKEIIPYGVIDPFGTYIGIDLATSWFRDLCLKGYKFRNLNVAKYCKHGWGKFLSGHLTLLSRHYYDKAEKRALIYLEEKFPEIFDAKLSKEDKSLNKAVNTQ